MKEEIQALETVDSSAALATMFAPWAPVVAAVRRLEKWRFKYHLALRPNGSMTVVREQFRGKKRVDVDRVELQLDEAGVLRRVE